MPDPEVTDTRTEPAPLHRAGFVAVLGRPNVGKSTLVNRAVGEKVSIVSDKPQTTRTRILGICQRPGAQVVFVDTPGIHKPKHRLNERMVEVSFAEAAANDVNLVVVDAAEGLGPGDRYVIERAAAASKPLHLALNKIDLIRRKELLLPLIDSCQKLAPWRSLVPISAQTGDHVDALLDAVTADLPEGPPLFPDDIATDQTERLLVGELIREQVIALTRDELPFATAVTVEGWEESAERTTISAVIWVDRDRHRGIVIGAGGQLVKAIGQAARASAEALLGRHVYLDLFVKVQKDWREDPRFLRRILPS